MSLTICPLTDKDYDAWYPLYRGYCEFYKVPFSDKLANRIWEWLMGDKNAVPHFYGLGGFVDDKMVGFAHYRPFPSSLDGTIACFFDDLFVDPAMRSKKYGRQLMFAVKKEAKKHGWSIVQWLTADDNYRARPLYDSIATRTMWITYEMQIDD